MPEYRPLPGSHEPAFATMTSNAFRPESGPHAFGPDADPSVFSALGERRGLFEGEELLAVCKHHRFRTRVGDSWLPMGGIAAIAVPPENRRRGHARRLLAASLAEYRDREIPLAALWPFEHAFYARFGWATATKYATLEMPPETLAFARGERDVEGSFVRLDADEGDRLDAVLSAHGAPYNLAIDRPGGWWRERVFDTWHGEPYAYGWERDGDLRGYAVYHVDEDGETRLRLVEHAWAGPDARLALLSFLADHDSQVDAVALREPDAGLLDLVPDPKAVEATVHAGPMVRLVDVAAALRSRPYPDDAIGTAVLGVDDPFLDGNDARFELALDGGEASVETVERAPDMTLGVGALSQLYVGYRSVDDLVRTRDATVRDAGARGLLADAFPPAEVFLRERF